MKTFLPKSVYYITIAHMLLAFGYTMSYVFIPIYLFEIKKLSPGIIGTITGTATIFGLLGWLPASSLTIKLGEKQLMMYAFSLRALNFLIIGIIIYYDLNYIFIIPFLFFNTFIMGISISPLESFLLNITNLNNRNIALSIHRTGVNFGWAFGPFIGGILSEKNFAIPFFGTFALTLIAVLFLNFTVIYENSKTKFPISGIVVKRVFSNKNFLYFTLNTIQLFIMMSLLITPLSIFLTEHHHISKTNLGKLYFLNGLLVVLLQIPISIWIKNLFLSLQTGMLLYFLGFFSIGIFSFWKNLNLLYISILILTIGEMLAVSPAQTIASILAQENEEIDSFSSNSHVSSFFGFIRSTGWAIGPIIAGWIQEFFTSPIEIWFLSSIFGLTGFIVYQILFHLKFQDKIKKKLN